MNAHLVFETDAVDIVALTQTVVFINQKFGYDEQGNPPDTFRRVRGSRQHQVNDVVGVFVIAPGNEYFLAADQVVIAIGDCF